MTHSDLVKRADMMHTALQRLEQRDKYKAALMEIEQRFRGKQSLHKDDCFAYQVASKALGITPPTEEQK